MDARQHIHEAIADKAIGELLYGRSCIPNAIRPHADTKFKTGIGPVAQLRHALKHGGPWPLGAIFILRDRTTIGAMMGCEIEVLEHIKNSGKYTAKIVALINFKSGNQPGCGIVEIMGKSNILYERGGVDMLNKTFNPDEETAGEENVAEEPKEPSRGPKGIHPLNTNFETVGDLRRALEVGKFRRR